MASMSREKHCLTLCLFFITLTFYLVIRLTIITKEFRHLTLTVDVDNEQLLLRAAMMAVQQSEIAKSNLKVDIEMSKEIVRQERRTDNERRKISMSSLMTSFTPNSMAKATASVIDSLSSSSSVILVSSSLEWELVTSLENSLEDMSKLQLLSTIYYSEKKNSSSHKESLHILTEISDLLMRQPRSNVVFVSGKKLIDVARILGNMKEEQRKMLMETRWFVVNMDWGQEQQLLSDESLVDVCVRMGLTSLKYLGMELNAGAESALQVLLLDHPMGHVTLDEITVYLNMVRLMKGSEDIKEPKVKTTGFLLTQQLVVTSSDEGVFFLASHLSPHWMPLIILKMEQERVTATHSLHSFTLKKKSLVLDHQCNESTRVGVSSHASYPWLDFHMAYESLDQIPDHLLIMMMNEDDEVMINLQACEEQVTLHCKEGPQRGRGIECRRQLQPPHGLASWSSGGDNMDHDVHMRRWTRSVWSTWMSLSPEVFRCTASVAGCDFCLYFLATYNLTASPAVCVSGCSLSAFGSCSAMVGKAIFKSINN